MAQPLGEIDRAVLAAGTADADGQVAAVVADVARQPGGDEAGDILAHLHHLGLRFEIVDHRAVAAVQGAQRHLVVRIGQAAHVENQFSVEGDAVLEAEGLEQQRQPPGAVADDELPDPVAQGVWFQIAGVNVMTKFSQALQAPPLLGDRLGERVLFVGQRVTSPRLEIALEQRVGLGVEEKELEFDMLRAKFCKLLWQHGDAVAPTDVDRRSDLVVATLAEMVDQWTQHLRGQVVHAIVRGVLKDVEGDRFA